MADHKKGFMQNWDEFSVAGSAEGVDASELYSNFLRFRKCVEALPKSELVRRGWIKSKDDFTSLVDLFREVSIGGKSRLFRKTDRTVSPLLLIWLSKVKSEAERRVLFCNVPQFIGIAKESLSDLARLSVKVDSVLQLPGLLFKHGIILVYLKALPRMKLDGAVFKLTTGHPVIGISFRYSRLDHFWFTLMHELAHVVLHEAHLEEPILDDFEQTEDGDVEVGANRLAKTSLIPRHIWRNCEPKYNKSRDVISSFAAKLGIHPSIVAGMLQREEGEYKAYSQIVNEINVRSIVFDDE